MKKIIQNLKYVFEPRSTAIVGASPTSGKIGNTILKNLINGKYPGKIYPVNPKYTKIMGHQCYTDVTRIKGKVDCAVIVTPAGVVPKIMQQCAKKKIPGIVVISGGFSEVNRADLENEVAQIAQKNNMAMVGVNCLGVYNPYARLDSNFNPSHRSGRPGPGHISFITQSGAVGACTMDLAARYKVGMAKFASYGNGTVLNEADYLEYLATDRKTKSIILYLEGAKDGRRLFEVMKKVNRKKPIVVMKAGKTAQAAEAAKSHTGNLAGNYMAYRAAFHQAKVTEAESFDEIFDFIRIFNQPLPKGKRIAVLTNGGGMGVLSTDALGECNLEMSKFEPKTQKALRKVLPSYATIRNPLDIIGDASVETYKKTIGLLMQDKSVDILLVVVLYQTPGIDERINDVLIRAAEDKRKPVAVIAVGGDYTEKNREVLEGYGVPTYAAPLAAVKALEKLYKYANFRKKM